MSETKSMDVSSADIFSMKLYDEIELREGCFVMSVPGGWIYRFEKNKLSGHVASSAVFVPYGI